MPHVQRNFKVLIQAHRTFCHVSRAVRDAKVGLPVVMLAASSPFSCLVLESSGEGMDGLATEAADAVTGTPSRIPALLEYLSAGRGVLDDFASVWVSPKTWLFINHEDTPTINRRASSFLHRHSCHKISSERNRDNLVCASPKRIDHASRSGHGGRPIGLLMFGILVDA